MIDPHKSSRWKQNQMVVKILGLLLAIFSLSMVLPMLVAWVYHEDSVPVFLTAVLTTACTGILMWVSCIRSRMDLDVRHGLLVVVLFWFVLSCFGAIPFYLNRHAPLDLINAWFESSVWLNDHRGIDHHGFITLYACVVVLSTRITVSGRYGYYCFGGCHFADAGCGGNANVPC